MFIPISTENPVEKAPWATLGLIGANTFFYILSSNLCGWGFIEFLYFFGLVPAFVTTGGVSLWYKTYPFITSQFIHGDFLHLFGNCFFLFIFGSEIEQRLGARRFLYFYLLCGIGSSLFFTLCNPDSFVPLIGASGAISGLMGAFLIYYPNVKIRLLFLFKIFAFFRSVTVPAYIYLSFLFLLQVVFGLIEFNSGIAYWGHVGGFIAGVAFCTVMLPEYSEARHTAIRAVPQRTRIHRKVAIKNARTNTGIFKKLVFGRLFDTPGYIFITWGLLQALFFVWIALSEDYRPAYAVAFLATIVGVISVMIRKDQQSSKRSILIIGRNGPEINSRSS
jgi:membrane associated rhomboid family serine protease